MGYERASNLYFSIRFFCSRVRRDIFRVQIGGYVSFKVPEDLRLLEHSSEQDGNNGAFLIRKPSSRNDLFIIASDGMGWEHVSVSKRYECPTWEEMCMVKKLFWDGPEDYAIQYHPPDANYVNNHALCLHLWRPTGDVKIPFPDDTLVGIKGVTP